MLVALVILKAAEPEVHRTVVGEIGDGELANMNVVTRQGVTNHAEPFRSEKIAV
jgi:hypothetical protein